MYPDPAEPTNPVGEARVPKPLRHAQSPEPSVTITEFLHARLSEREAAARTAGNVRIYHGVPSAVGIQYKPDW